MQPAPSFDSWTIVFLIAAVQGFFTALVLWRWRRGHAQANRLLAFLPFLFAVTLVEYVLYWTRYLYDWPHIADLSAQFPFLYGPILWLYLRTIYEGKPLTRKDWWLFAPFLLASLVFGQWYLADTATKQAVIAGEINFVWWAGRLMRIPFWASLAWMVGFALWNWAYVLRQPRVGHTGGWARWLAGFYIVFVLAYISYFVLIRFPFFNTTWDYHISAVMTAMIYLIAYSGYAQPAVFGGFNWNEPAAPAKYRNSGLTADASRSLLQNLQLLMREERIYHDPEISLDKLAARLNASKHHVSQVINEQLGTTFFEYVNQLRVEEARGLLAETTRSDFHVIEIAYAVGFNNKVSFNSAFKKATGMTPTEYRRSHSVSDEEAGPAGARG
ncbi:MAG: helix-turn-helix domain-containing protein [Saprospiraceae bacterium]